MLIHHLLPSPCHSHTSSISKISVGTKFARELVPHKNQKRLKRQKRAGGEMVMMTKKGCLVLLTLALAMCQVRSQMKPPLGGQAGFPPNGPVTVHVSR